MAVVSHPALSPEWSFPSPLNPFDAPTFSSHIELVDHTAPMGVVHQLHIKNKRRAHEIEWEDDDVVDRVDRVKKPKTSANDTVDPQQLHGNTQGPQTPPDPQATSTAQSPHIEQVISILVDALASPTPTTPPRERTATPSNSNSELEITVSISSNVPTTYPPSNLRLAPTSPLSESPNRRRFVRKVIGGSCAGRTEPSLTRWVLCKNHFLRYAIIPCPFGLWIFTKSNSVRSLDPTIQSSDWVQTLHEMGWEELHPFYQAQAAMRNAQDLASLSAFSRWIEDDFDYDGTEDCDGEWSDEEEEDGDMREDTWDSSIMFQLPEKLS